MEPDLLEFIDLPDTAHTTRVADLLGEEAGYLLDHTCETIPREGLMLPGPDFVDRVWAGSDRSPRALRALQALFSHGRLGGSGYLSLLAVDHGITRGAGSAFASNPRYFDPANVAELAVEGGCSALVSTHGLGLATILFCYLRNEAFEVDDVNHEFSADLTGQAIHLGATIEADLVKQKQPTSNGGYLALGGGGTGLIAGRKAFQRPLPHGIQILHAIQDVYLDPDVSIA